MSSSKVIVLKSSDGETFEVDEAVALESQTIKHLIEDNCADTSIPLPNDTSEILAKVIEYCKKHGEAPKASDGDKSSDEDLKSFDKDFVKGDHLFDLIMEAVALESHTIKHIIEDNCADTIIPLPNVTSKILAKVIEYCKKHVEAAKVSDGDKSSDEDLKSFDNDFVKVDQGTLYDLILAANYLNIRSLLDLTCQTVADMIRARLHRRSLRLSTSKMISLLRKKRRFAGRMRGRSSEVSIL